MTVSLLRVDQLVVEFPTRDSTLRALDRVSLEISAGEILGLVGESGAGKSITGLATIGLLDPPGRISSGQVLLQGERIDNLSEQELQTIRGRKIGAIFQDPLTALNPLYTVGQQLVETIRTHLHLTVSQARARAIELLKETGIPAAEERIDHYPHQFSGGMRQRVVIALALCAEPALVIADEPTTALDVSIQAQIIGLLREACRQRGAGVMLITHDLGVIAETCDRVAVMYSGRVIEQGPVADVIHRPSHPYTVGLMAAIPTLDQRRKRLSHIPGNMPRLDGLPSGCAFHPRCVLSDDRCASQRPELDRLEKNRDVACWRSENARTLMGETEIQDKAPQADRQAESSNVNQRPLVAIRGLYRTFDVSPSWLIRLIYRRPRLQLRAVMDIQLELSRGETFALVGESGCGKTTLARVVVGLDSPTQGEVRFDGVGLHATLRSGRSRDLRQKIQMIFQDPYSSLNPRWSVHQIVAEPLYEYGLALSREEAVRQVDELLTAVGLSPADQRKYPHQFSGGQRQRISIARALAANPEFLVCDEPTSALDVSVQAQILNLMQDLQTRLGLTYLLISHNLAIVQHFSDRVGVMYLGQIVEQGVTDAVFTNPRHPYTRLLMDSIPRLAVPDRARIPIQGEVPNPLTPPSGCVFHPRCPHAQSRCRSESPLLKVAGDRQLACHAVEEGRL